MAALKAYFCDGLSSQDKYGERWVQCARYESEDAVTAMKLREC
jgi:hypothetical protein